MIYEVTVTLPKAAKDGALSYMRTKHISDVLKHHAFSKATFYVENETTSQTFSFSTHYYFSDPYALDDYLKGYALEMREDALRVFGQFNPTISRRILNDEAIVRRAEPEQ